VIYSNFGEGEPEFPHHFTDVFFMLRAAHARSN
jgi:hypothetical protein